MGLTLGAWLFGAVILGLILLGLLFVFWPLLASQSKKTVDHPQSRRDANIALYEARVADLHNAVSLGEMSPEDAELQEQEAARHLLSDTQAEPESVEDREGGNWLFPVLAIMLPLLAITVYLQGDGWRLINSDAKTTPWDFVLHRAHEQLEKNPQDQETMVFLARSYRALENYADAARTYRELNKISGFSNPDFLVEEGEILALIHEGDMRGRPTELINKALSINPHHGRALWYAGLAAVQRDDNEQAVKYWQALSRQELPSSFRQVLDRQLQRLGSQPVSSSPEVAAPDVIKVYVNVEASLVKGLPGSTPVFVYARPQGGAGRPLAARRLLLSELPTSVSLNDSMQMADGPSLQDFDNWTLLARVSLSGVAGATAGDPYGEIDLNKEQALANLPLLIDSVWGE